MAKYTVGRAGGFEYIPA
ncbi:hypothetical protein RSAG8_12361, partial [Rhizoctonia solani AG-8 WAC10335]